MAKTRKLARLSVDVSHAERRQIKLAAASRDQTIREYVREAVAARLRRDRMRVAPPLHQTEDPVLGELWDNTNDAAYDRL